LNKLANIGFRRPRSDGDSAAVERIKAWTRERFALAEDVALLVAEVVCTVPGCPPIETVIAFWTEADKRHHFKVFKPLSEVVPDDLPPAFMKNALADLDGIDCPCC
jgi:nitrate reductase delta subunit